MSLVLIIEPDSALAQIYAQALQDGGYRIAKAATAQQAIHAADMQVPDLVLLELQLPAHNGIEFLYEFRSYPEWQHIPVVINSYIPPQEYAAVHEVLTDRLGVRAMHYKPRATLQALLQSIAACMQTGQGVGR